MVIIPSWDVISSVSTAIASVIALFGLLVTIIAYTRQRNEERAAQIRSDIRSFAGSTTQVVQLLRDGSPLISAAWYAVETLRERVSENTSVTEVHKLLGKEGIGLSLAVVSWGKSPEAQNLRSALAEHLAASKLLPGDVRILSTAGDILQRIAQDTYMSGFLRQLSDQDIMTVFLKNTENMIDIDELLAQLLRNLQGFPATYFVSRFEIMLDPISDLISTGAALFTDLESKHLVRVARIRKPMYEEQADRTFIDAIREYRVSLERYLPAVLMAEIAPLAKKVEEVGSKDPDRRNTLLRDFSRTSK